MKKIIALLVVAMFALSGIALAKDYIAVTPDNTVESIDQVQVQETESVQAQRFLTLQALITERAVQVTSRDERQRRIDAIDALILLIEPVAATVKLKVKVEEPKEPK